MDLIKFFTTDNKSGYRTKEKWLVANHPNLYNNILSYCNSELKDLPFKVKVWHYIHDIKEIPTCECGKKLKFKKSIKDGYGSYCSIQCTNKSKKHINKVKKTNNKLYGGNSPMSSIDVINKQKNTTMGRFGVDNIFKNTEYIKNKTIEKLGVDHISKLDSTKNKIRQSNLEKYNIDYPIKNHVNRKISFDNKKNTFVEKYSNLNILDIDGNDITIKCGVCNSNYLINRSVLFHRYKITKNPCTVCYPIKAGKSILEKELVDFISSLNIDYVENDRTILNGKELDIVIPSKKIAIEFNDLYWHSDKYLDKNYHLNKTEITNVFGYRLIHIFEDEWLHKKDIVKSRLKNLLGITDNRIYARKCTIKEVPTKEKTKFLNDNHIQGAVGSKINLGLYYDNELVSIMTFGGKRVVLGSKSSKGDFELLRFCNKLDYSIVGGASKLLKHFIKTYNPKELISYADRRWSSGKLYYKLGFKISHITKPNYWYVVNNKREHRFKYRKSNLVKEGYDKSMSEYEIMYNLGYHRIYDCGNIKFYLDL